MQGPFHRFWIWPKPMMGPRRKSAGLTFRWWGGVNKSGCSSDWVSLNVVTALKLLSWQFRSYKWRIFLSIKKLNKISCSRVSLLCFSPYGGGIRGTCSKTRSSVGCYATVKIKLYCCVFVKSLCSCACHITVFLFYQYICVAVSLCLSLCPLFSLQHCVFVLEMYLCFAV